MKLTNIIKNLFGQKEKPIQSYSDFWNWFQKHHKTFYKAVKNHTKIEEDFLNLLSPKLKELNEGFYFLAGMSNKDTAEVVFTADGDIKQIVFAEDLVKAAPMLKGWQFTALKPPLDIEEVNIEMRGFRFHQDNIHFYSNDLTDYPDEIDITMVHDDYNEDTKDIVGHGCYIFLDHYLGELQAASTIDNLSMTSKTAATQKLIPIEKLKSFLVWREKEFVEKYKDSRRDTEHDQYAILEAQHDNGNPIIATVNQDLLKWDGTASHPWIVQIDVQYDGSQNNGLPNETDYQLLKELEDKLELQLKDFEGYLNIGHQTSNGVREIYLACKEFRKPSKVVFNLKKEYEYVFTMKYDIYKDKYWRSFEGFKVGVN